MNQKFFDDGRTKRANLLILFRLAIFVDIKSSLSGIGSKQTNIPRIVDRFILVSVFFVINIKAGLWRPAYFKSHYSFVDGIFTELQFHVW